MYNKKYYSLLGNEYRKFFRFQIIGFLRAIYIKALFNPQSVLDVGCGMGNLVEMLRRLGVEAWGIDVSSYALAQIPQKIKRFFKKGSITNIPFADKEFEVVTTTSVLEHISPKDIPLAIKECARVAKKGIYHEIAVLEDKTTINKDPTHVSKYKASWWFKKLKSQLKGWRVERGLRIPILKNGIFVIRR